jgi:hypothetical protein
MLRTACTAAFLLGLTLLAPPAYSASVERLPQGVTIAGVAVGGLGPNEARAELRRQLAPVFESPINVRFHGRRHIAVPTHRLGQVVRYRDMVSAAYDQLARKVPVHVRMMRTIDGDRLTVAAFTIARPLYRPARNATVRLGIAHVRLRRGRTGRAVDVRELRRHLLEQLRKPTGKRRAWGHVRWTKPSVRRRDLRRRIPTYVSVSRSSKIVRLWKHLRIARRYRVAVGAAGYDTPAGLHHVLSKQVDPTWYVPNRPWAGSLAGQTIPPGDPRNPLKARFISLGGGVGFHGTADLASIGQAASHGCIRMTVPDVISLYGRVSVGTPVLIR